MRWETIPTQAMSKRETLWKKIFILSQVFHQVIQNCFFLNKWEYLALHFWSFHFSHFLKGGHRAGGLEVFKVFSPFSEKAADLHRWQNMNIFPHFTLVMHTFLSVQYQTMESQMRSYKHYKQWTYYWCQTLNTILVQNTKNTEIIKFSNTSLQRRNDTNYLNSAETSVNLESRWKRSLIKAKTFFRLPIL